MAHPDSPFLGPVKNLALVKVSCLVKWALLDLPTHVESLKDQDGEVTLFEMIDLIHGPCEAS